MDPNKTQPQERREIDVLLNKGFNIDVTYTEKKYKDGLMAIFEKPMEVTKKITLEFREPTLAVLDLVTAEYLNLRITEPPADSPSAKVIASAHKTVSDNARSMARIVAIFALGEKAFVCNGTDYDINVDDIERLTEIIFHWATPKKLERIISLCTALSNLPDFLTSIRLTGASRTTRPANLVE